MKVVTIFTATALFAISAARIGGPCENTSTLCLCLTVNDCNDLEGRAFERAPNGKWPCPDDGNDIWGCTLTEEVLCSRVPDQNIVDCTSTSSVAFTPTFSQPVIVSTASSTRNSTQLSTKATPSTSGTPPIISTSSQATSRIISTTPAQIATNGGTFIKGSGIPHFVEWLAGLLLALLI